MYPSEKCEYSSLRDAAEVIGGLSVNIDDMLKTGVVKSSTEDLEDNDIDAPEQIIGRVSDEFAAIDAMRALRALSKKQKSSEKSVEKAVEKAAASAATEGAAASSSSNSD